MESFKNFKATWNLKFYNEINVTIIQKLNLHPQVSCVIDEMAVIV